MRFYAILLMIVVFLCSCAKTPPVQHDQTAVDYFNETTFSPEPPQSHGYDETSNWTGWNLALAGFALGGQVADVASTQHQTAGPYCSEGNPIWGSDSPSVALMLGVKLLIVGGGYLFIESFIEEESKQLNRNIWGTGAGIIGFGLAGYNMTLDCY